MSTGKFGGEAKEYAGPSSPFLSWQIANVRVGSKVFPVTATTGLSGTEAAAVYNLGHGSFRSAVAYVFRNIVRAVMVDNGRAGVEYTLVADMHGFGLKDGITLNLDQQSRQHTLLNKKAAARTFAEIIVNAAVNGYYVFLRGAGWERADNTEAPEALVKPEQEAGSSNNISF